MRVRQSKRRSKTKTRNSARFRTQHTQDPQQKKRIDSKQEHPSTTGGDCFLHLRTRPPAVVCLPVVDHATRSSARLPSTCTVELREDAPPPGPLRILGSNRQLFFPVCQIKRKAACARLLCKLQHCIGKPPNKLLVGLQNAMAYTGERTSAWLEGSRLPRPERTLMEHPISVLEQILGETQ